MIDRSLVVSDGNDNFGFGSWETTPTKSFTENLSDWWNNTFYLANPDGTRADTSIKDLSRGPTIEFETTELGKPSIFMKDPFKAGNTVKVVDGPNGEVIVVDETEASKTQLVGGDDESETTDLGVIAAVGGIAILLGLIFGLILD